MQLDPDAFHARAIEARPMLLRLARRLTRDAAAADDLVQETFCRALRYRAGFVLGATGMGPWLATILRNAWVASAATRARWPGLLTPADAADLPDDRRPAARGDERHGPAVGDVRDLADDMDERLARALGDLGDRYRRPFVMWAVHGMTYADIAAQLGVPVGTVLSRLARARSRLHGRVQALAAERRLVRRPERRNVGIPAMR